MTLLAAALALAALATALATVLLVAHRWLAVADDAPDHTRSNPARH